MLTGFMIFLMGQDPGPPRLEVGGGDGGHVMIHIINNLTKIDKLSIKFSASVRGCHGDADCRTRIRLELRLVA